MSLSGCSQPTENANTNGTVYKEDIIAVRVSQETSLRFDSTEITRFFNNYPYVKTYEQNIRNFYSKRNYTYAWFERSGLIEQAVILSNRLSNLESDGIYKRLIYKQNLDSLLDEQNIKSNTKKPNITLELLLTAEYFMYSRVAWNGMDASISKSVNWFIPRKSISYDQYLDSILKTPTNRPLPDEPVYRQYELLRSYLKKYRALESNDPWKPLSVTNGEPKFGDTSSFILQVKKRLFKLEDYVGDTLNNSFDLNLVAALKRFQERNGLQAEGVLDNHTLIELNVSLKSRIKQILVNMERSRWLPLSVSGDHVAVNVPEFKLHVYHSDSLLWSCNAVVGETVHPTIQFYGEIKYIVFSPYWNIPPSIIRNEIIPAMKKHPGYLTTHRMEITGYRNGLPIIRQKPGRANSLGLVKFTFPNSYNIYLHDTPSKSLFNETSRAFSHGCIRISEPEKLAGFLLKNMDQWNAQKIKDAMRPGKEKYVTLKNPVPVFIGYFTAFIDRRNRMNFRKDIYNLDDRLAAMILSGEGY